MIVELYVKSGNVNVPVVGAEKKQMKVCLVYAEDDKSFQASQHF